MNHFDYEVKFIRYQCVGSLLSGITVITREELRFALVDVLSRQSLGYLRKSRGGSVLEKIVLIKN
jgi:hypothetical protein